jgi:hypothetical protein
MAKYKYQIRKEPAALSYEIYRKKLGWNWILSPWHYIGYEQEYSKAKVLVKQFILLDSEKPFLEEFNP